MAKIQGVGAAILAGGDAVRMAGQNKALLKVDGRRIIDRQLDVLGPLFAELFIVANDPAPYASLGLKVVPDLQAGQGPLMGLLTALEHSACRRLFVVACDMPHIHEAAVRYLCQDDDDVEARLPRVGQRVEPLFSCYCTKVKTVAREQLALGDRKLFNLTMRLRCRFLDEDQLRELDPTLQFLQNCNTPQDLGPR